MEFRCLWVVGLTWQAMLDEQEALFERPSIHWSAMHSASPSSRVLGRAKLHKLMEQEGMDDISLKKGPELDIWLQGLCSPMRQHVAENVRSRLKEDWPHLLC